MSGEKIKVAVCLSGEPRSSMASFPYIYESLINLGPKYEVDVYIHSWKGFRALNLYNPKSFKIDFIDENVFFYEYSSFISKTNTSPKFENFYKSINHYTPNSNNIKNLFLMFLSLKECFNLIKKPYDIFIRSRLDVMFQSEFPTNEYIYKILKKEIDICLNAINFTVGTYDGIPNYEIYNDQFAIGNYKAMEAYFNTFNNLGSLINETNNLNSIFLLSKHLSNSNLNILDIPLSLEIIRKSQIIPHNQIENFIYLDE